MKIGIDISQIVYKGTGVARFTQGLVEAILQNDTQNEWIFFASLLRQKIDPELAKKIQEKGHKLVQIPLPPTALSFLWNNLHKVNVESFTGKLDWFISSDWTEPPAACKKATIIHDLTFKRFPETVDEKVKKTHEKRLSHVAKESDLIIADSFATKQDVKSILNIDAKKIHIIYPGVTIQKPTQSDVENTLKKYNITHPFILTVGKIEPRKNLKRLIQAYNSLSKKNSTLPQLLLVGPKGWEEIKDLENKNIRLVGQVTDAELYSLYSACLFFIMPSIFEGFGYPAIEAMQLGAPTALSETSSLKELGKDASLFFNPLDVSSIENALMKMIDDENLRKELIIKGNKKGKAFEWEAYYNNLIKLLN